MSARGEVVRVFWHVCADSEWPTRAEAVARSKAVGLGGRVVKVTVRSHKARAEKAEAEVAMLREALRYVVGVDAWRPAQVNDEGARLLAQAAGAARAALAKGSKS